MPRSRFSDAFILGFWQRLVPTLPPENVRHLVDGPCLVWSGATSADGHGKVQVDGTTLYCHRVAFEIEHGREPGPLLRHKCGVAGCASPAHLAEGDDRDNHLDSVAHGTYSPPPRMCGAAHPESKLSDSDMQRLWAMREAGHTQQEIADALGVSQSLVSQVLTGRTRTCTR